MAIKTIIPRDEVEKVEDYPCLKIFKEDQQIILFISKNSGLVLGKGKGVKDVGYFSDKWVESVFELYDSTICIQNV